MERPTVRFVSAISVALLAAAFLGLTAPSVVSLESGDVDLKTHLDSLSSDEQVRYLQDLQAGGRGS
ncbi:MAG: hypothetical protein JSW58_09370, partial [Candidatus Latescibacterota bacterium]